MTHVPMYQVVAAWKAVATMEPCAARNHLYWVFVNALRAQGFAGDARRPLERAARWY